MESGKKKYFKFFHSSKHSLYNNGYHIVFATKYRKKIIGPVLTKELKDIFQRMAEKKSDGMELIGLGVEVDHVHILVSIPPSLSIARAVQRIKGLSSRIILDKYPELINRIGKRAIWQTGYFCKSLGVSNIPQIKAYLGKQVSEEYLGDL